jgi:hypothetical protein
MICSRENLKFKSITQVMNHLFIGINQPSIYPGKKVEGVVVYVVNTPVRVNKIGVDIDGEEVVYWNQGIMQDQVCTDRATILKNNLILMDGGVLEVGVYHYNFSYDLPTKIPLNYEETNVLGAPVTEQTILPDNSILPISFEGDARSYIRYLAKAFVEIVPILEDDKEGEPVRIERTSPFKVVEQFDPEILVQPAKIVQAEKSFLLGGNPVRAELSVANGGVLFIGQKLFVHVKVNNQSTRSVNGLFLRLQQFITMKAHNKENEEQTIYRKEVMIKATVENSNIPPGQSYNQDLMLEIPTHIPGTIRHGSYIGRHYEINLDVELFLAGSLTLTVPVLLLEWSSQLKGIVPDLVPVSIRKLDEEEAPDPEQVEEFKEEHKETD